MCFSSLFQIHYNQPLFTLVAAGIKDFSATYKQTESVLPSCVGWMKDYAEDFDPCNNTVFTRGGDKIVYDYMVVAVGLKNDYEQVGLYPEFIGANMVKTPLKYR